MLSVSPCSAEIEGGLRGFVGGEEVLGKGEGASGGELDPGCMSITRLCLL